MRKKDLSMPKRTPNYLKLGVEVFHDNNYNQLPQLEYSHLASWMMKKSAPLLKILRGSAVSILEKAEFEKNPSLVDLLNRAVKYFPDFNHKRINEFRPEALIQLRDQAEKYKKDLVRISNERERQMEEARLEMLIQLLGQAEKSKYEGVGLVGIKLERLGFRPLLRRPSEAEIKREEEDALTKMFCQLTAPECDYLKLDKLESEELEHFALELSLLGIAWHRWGETAQCQLCFRSAEPGGLYCPECKVRREERAKSMRARRRALLMHDYLFQNDIVGWSKLSFGHDRESVFGDALAGRFYNPVLIPMLKDETLNDYRKRKDTSDKEAKLQTLKNKIEAVLENAKRVARLVGKLPENEKITEHLREKLDPYFFSNNYNDWVSKIEAAEVWFETLSAVERAMKVGAPRGPQGPREPYGKRGPQKATLPKIISAAKLLQKLPPVKVAKRLKVDRRTLHSWQTRYPQYFSG